MKEYLLNKISIRLNVGPDLHQPNARKARVQFSYKPKKAWYWKVAKRIFNEVSFVNMSPNVSYSWAGARPKPTSLSPMNPKAQKVKKLQLLISEKAQKVPEINSDWTLPSPFHRCLIAPREKKYHQVDPLNSFQEIWLYFFVTWKRDSLTSLLNFQKLVVGSNPFVKVFSLNFAMVGGMTKSNRALLRAGLGRAHAPTPATTTTTSVSVPTFNHPFAAADRFREVG